VNSLDLLLLLTTLTTLLALLMGRWRPVGWLLTLLYALQLALLADLGLTLQGGGQVVSQLQLTLLGYPIGLVLDGFGWLFAAITLLIALFSSWFGSGAWSAERSDRRAQHLTLSLNVTAMLLLLASGDLLTLFITWELVSWSGFALMAYAGGRAADAALRYLIYAIAGAMALLAALLLVEQQGGSFQFAAVATAVTTLDSAGLWLLLLLFFTGFGVKMALLPFHLWQAEAYALTPGPGAAFLGAISSRMGLFALMLVVVKLIGLEHLAALAIPYTFLDAQSLLAWIAAFTIIIPTFIALTQSDARRLLAWHGIGQTGYMVLGIVIGTELGVAGGLLHVFNYATYQAALFLSVSAVIYRTGTADLDRLGGLITRMPLAYVTMLMGIIGLAGLPPMNGFVSKWMVYKALLDNGQPLLFVAAIIGTLGTILSVYKLIHNTFLGQLRAEHQAVREVPWSMSVPMLALAAIGFITGWMPGLALSAIDVAQQALGIATLPHHLGGFSLSNGNLDMLWVVGALLASIGIGALIFFAGNRRHLTHQLDNYAGGHFLSSSHRYHYSHNFYAGLMHLIGPWYRGTFRWLEQALINSVEVGGNAALGLFRNSAMLLYMVAALTLALWLLL